MSAPSRRPASPPALRRSPVPAESLSLPPPMASNEVAGCALSTSIAKSTGKPGSPSSRSARPATSLPLSEVSLGPSASVSWPGGVPGTSSMPSKLLCAMGGTS